MKQLKYLILIPAIILSVLAFVIVEAYFVRFSNGISDNIDNWMLFISICNWIFISILTGINIWIFYKLTTSIAESNDNQFLEQKIARTENVILNLRIKDYEKLRETGNELKKKIAKQEKYTEELNKFWYILLSMQNTSLFSYKDKVGKSQIDTLCESFLPIIIGQETNPNIIGDKIDRCLLVVEFLIFIQQLQDDRIVESLNTYPERFDSTIISIYNYFKK